MLGLGLGVDRASFVAAGFDADYQAVLDRGTTLGYALPTGNALSGGDTLVKSLKSAGIWSKLDVFYVYATNGDSDFATLNWITPASFQCTKVNSPTFTANEGFTTNATTSYINTNWTPSTDGVNYQLDSASLGVYVRSAVHTANLQVLYGARGGGGANTTTEINDKFAQINNTGGPNTLASSTAAGFRHINRADSANISRYINGTGTTIAQASNGLTPFSIYIGAFNAAGGAIFFSANQFSVFFAGASLASEAPDFFTAVETYMDAIGKGVVA